MTSTSSRHGRPRWSTDWAWGGAGVTLATASAGFAGYMIMTAPAEVTGFGSKDFGVFVQWDRRSPALAATHGALATASHPPALPVPAPLDQAAAVAGHSGVDLTPTGSIPDEPGSKPGTQADSYRLREVQGDRALIEHHGRFTLVKPGSILAGAGEVLSIERQGGGWIVRTASGVIGGT